MSNSKTFTIRDYIIQKKRIGHGAFSNIYKGYHKKTNKKIAVKEIKLDTINKYKDSIKRETKIMRHLDHPNIINLYDTIIDNHNDNIYLILDYFPKGDLSNFLKKRPLKEKYAHKFTSQLSNGLEYLLQNKIIHRDLKPQNILVTNLGDIKITDFGFARYFEENTILNTICGSPLYMAPEIVKNRKYDLKSDLWSVGVILYEMLVGRQPYRGKNIFDLVKNIEKKSIILPSNIILTDECKDLLFKLLKKNPIERIKWEDFFSHKWIKNIVKEREDMLMEISTFNSFSEMNDLIKNNSESFFLNNNSFTKKDIKLITSNKSSKIGIDLYTSNPEYDLSLKFNFNLEESNESYNFQDSDSDGDIFYDSYENTNHRELDSYINVNKMSPQSIQIVNDIKNNKYLKEFEYISSIETESPKSGSSSSSSSSSLMDYLSGSLYFFKQSYKYISKFNSL
tara:strand:- start:827 stop:2182 length:1356 start_codon:yes stop_codon:yes gene_type:complete